MEKHKADDAVVISEDEDNFQKLLQITNYLQI